MNENKTIDKNKILKRLKQLSKLINEYNYHYFEKDKPIISDKDYDN